MLYNVAAHTHSSLISFISVVRKIRKFCMENRRIQTMLRVEYNCFTEDTKISYLLSITQKLQRNSMMLLQHTLFFKHLNGEKLTLCRQVCDRMILRWILFASRNLVTLEKVIHFRKNHLWYEWFIRNIFVVATAESFLSSDFIQKKNVKKICRIVNWFAALYFQIKLKI